ncbi:uncharacterized protein At4g22758 [Cannabis sativa]|uniref:uncharacterized protein At4g22758 n=1 Tax=Cannabis sativa TaxID=3483 RepID=UPI0029C9F107|nr:uncharacterized protein At4g22758 [Cannabis sativa]
MPSPKSNRRVNEEKNRRGKLTEKASSFHGKSFTTDQATATSQLRRPKTLPDLLPSRSLLTTSLSSSSSMIIEGRPINNKLTKILLNVTIQGSVGAVQVLISLEATVGDLIAAALSQYAKEGRRPILVATDPSRFNLHYSQFSLECLDREEQVNGLGSRNFFMCPSKTTSSSSSSSCANEAEKASKNGFSWLKFMEFKF